MLTDIAIALAKITKSMVCALNLGQGSALTGRVGLALSPKLLEYFGKQTQKSKFRFLVTGTNGKTTTNGMLKSIVLAYYQEQKLKAKIVCNDFGNNLEYAITSEFINSYDFADKLDAYDFVLEVDEATIKKLGKPLHVQAVLVTNIYRDQLDRFGELDSTQKLIAEGINTTLGEDPVTVFLNADDKNVCGVKSLVNSNKAEFVFYGAKAAQIQNLEAEASTQQPDFYSEILHLEKDSSLVKFVTQDQETIELRVPVPGSYNVYNATAAGAMAYAHGIGLESIKRGIENYQSAFGRSESKVIKNQACKIFLIKNPAGCTEVLKHLEVIDKEVIMIAINDDYADGRDVSWLWDAEFELLAKTSTQFVCSGTRACDMALRLKYAGLDEAKIQVEPILTKAIDLARQVNSKPSRDVIILPTYTALLSINKL